MSLIKLLKNHIRTFDYEPNTDLDPRYSIQSVELEPGINRSLPTVVFFLFFAVFWLGMENYTHTLQDIIDFFRRRRR